MLELYGTRVPMASPPKGVLTAERAELLSVSN